MRLINTTTLHLEEFQADSCSIPKYVVLSHTWEEEEITFREWESRYGGGGGRGKGRGRGRLIWEAEEREASREMEMETDERKMNGDGLGKIEGTCKLARELDLNYAWIDTICIDKSSSAELSEAINSMWEWYKGASVCVVYLGDVVVPEWWRDEGGGRAGGCYKEKQKVLRDKFKNCRWFTRGWTLQELLAPEKVIFYSRDWTKLGEKSKGLETLISQFTGIDPSYLLGYSPVHAAPIALRMFWLSRRKTTRIEDMAYCMLGVFDINMPLLYGEGTKAFIRLQEEIIKVSVDHTIFCWSWISTVPLAWTNLLAPDPATFRHSSGFRRANAVEQAAPYSMTNAGLAIKLPVIQAWSYNFAVLMVHQRRRSQHWRVCIPIRSLLRPSTSDFLGTYRRIPYPAGPVSMPASWTIGEVNMFVKSKMLTMFHHTSSLQRVTEPRGLLLTLGEGLPVHIPVPMPIHVYKESANTGIKITMANRVCRAETYPEELFDESRSVFRLLNRVVDGNEDDDDNDEGWNGLLALGDREAGCVVFICCIVTSGVDGTKRKRTRKSTKWYCHILPSSFWADNEGERARLLGFLTTQVKSVEGGGEIRRAVCRENGAYFVIDKDEDEDGNVEGVDGEGNSEDGEGGCEKPIVAARLELGLGKERIIELSRGIGRSLHI